MPGVLSLHCSVAPGQVLKEVHTGNGAWYLHGCLVAWRSILKTVDRMSFSKIFTSAASLALLVCHGASVTASAETMRDLIESYKADSELLSRHWAITGDSDAELSRETRLLHDWQGRLKQVNFEKLSDDQRVEYVLLRNELESSLAHLAKREAERRELSEWLPIRVTIDTLADSRVRGEPLVPETAAGIMAPLAEKITKLQEQLKAAKEAAKEAEKQAKNPGAVPPPSGAKTSQEAVIPMASVITAKSEEKIVPLPTPYQAFRSAEAVSALLNSLKGWFENYNGFTPEFAWWVRQPYDETTKALESYGKFLREELAVFKGKDEDPLLGKAIGEEELMRELTHEFIPYKPQELIALAEREFSWCELQMKEAAQEMQLGDDWKKALERAKTSHVKPGEQEGMVREEGLLAINFVKSRQLVTVPPDCEEWWGTRMLSPDEQKQTPYAAYSGHDVLVAFASETMKHGDKLMSMRGNSRPFMHNVVPHELIPGHHLQRFMGARNKPYRGLFSTPFFVEGWALYWEMRLWDLGYHDTPEEKVGALFWRMHRCPRIIVTLKFHLGQMKPDEMVKFLTDRVGHEKFGATSEVRRFIKGNYSPLYQCGYMLGGLQLMALHREVVGSGKMTEMAFHDELLKLGPVPVELLRATLLELPLTPDYTTQWKFDGGL